MDDFYNYIKSPEIEKTFLLQSVFNFYMMQCNGLSKPLHSFVLRVGIKSF